jgi:hypothetical protein
VIRGRFVNRPHFFCNAGQIFRKEMSEQLETDLMKTKILPNAFLNVGVLFGSACLLAAASGGVLNFSNTSLRQPQAGPEAREFHPNVHQSFTP